MLNFFVCLDPRWPLGGAISPPTCNGGVLGASVRLFSPTNDIKEEQWGFLYQLETHLQEDMNKWRRQRRRVKGEADQRGRCESAL